MNLKNVNNRLSQIGIQLESGVKMEGGKINSPKETFQTAVKQLQNLSTQIDYQIVKIHNHDHLNIPVYRVLSQKVSSTGKGLNEEFSNASAIMEFIERLSWIRFLFSQQENIICTSIYELGDLDFCEEYFANNLADSTVIKQNFSEIRKVKMRWTKAYSLTKDRFIWYPLSWHNAVQCSNGLACGNSFTEAIVQAICEVVERHAYSKVSFSNATLPTIKVDHSQWTRVANLLEKFESCGVSIVLKDMTEKTKIPSVLAWTRDKSCSSVNNVCGMGTHLNPENAAIRAITESAQVRAQLLEWRSHFTETSTFDEYYKNMPKKGWGVLNDNTFYERMADDPRIINSSQIEDFQSNDILNDLEALIDMLKKESHEIFVINKTHPELCIPTIRIFVPTLKYYVLSSDTPVSFDSILAHVYLDTADIDNAVIYLRKTKNEILLKKANALEKLQKNGLSSHECVARLQENLKINMANEKAKYRLNKSIRITEDLRNGHTLLFNPKNGLRAKITTSAFHYLKMLEDKTVEQILRESQNLEEDNQEKFLDFLDKFLVKGFIEFIYD